jgi:hypothetical protein
MAHPDVGHRCSRASATGQRVVELRDEVIGRMAKASATDR